MIQRLFSRRPGRRGNMLIEFSIGASLFVTAFTATFQYGYIFYRYNTLENAVNSAARYASLAPYDSANTTPSSAFLAKVRNMVVYGKPSAGTNPVVPGLTTSHVVLTPVFANGVPVYMKVHINGFTIDGVFGKMNCTGKPVVRYAYQGRWAPIQ